MMISPALLFMHDSNYIYLFSWCFVVIVYFVDLITETRNDYLIFVLFCFSGEWGQKETSRTRL